MATGSTFARKTYHLGGEFGPKKTLQRKTSDPTGKTSSITKNVTPKNMPNHGGFSLKNFVINH